jgi:phospholipid/cholesterol/gamma-HCH transport system substrate-binding protein
VPSPRRNYVFLGVFVVLTLGLLLWLAANVGALGKGSGDRYTVRLDHAAGLVEDNAVKVAGVQVGAIERVDVEHATAVLTLRLDKPVVLRADTTAIVRAKSLLGEKYLQLDPGSLDQPVLPPGSEIPRVQTTFEIDELLNALEPVLGGESSIAGSLAPLAQRLDRLLAAAEGQDGQPPLVDREELRRTIEDAEKTVQAMRRIAEDNEQGVKELIGHSNRILGDPEIPRIVQNLDRVSSSAAEDLPDLLARTDRALANLEKVTAQLDDERATRVGRSIDDLSTSAANLRKLSEDLQGLGGDLRPLIEDLSALARRAASIDEKAVRKFLQSEGIRINLGTPRKARDELRGLGVEP